MVIDSAVNGGAALPTMQALGLFYRITFKRTGLGESQLVRDYLIEHIAHSWNARTATWTTVFVLSPFEIVVPWFILDNTIYGKLDSNDLAY